ncbi:phBC6A51 family helix-turn-helix protein [Brevibacillus migulae]|uniref:phBC6A51 family helix-turn-helix protein n=1 Tax=Brevibacillus migulae TaxID=1644114 RepID=UPI001432063F|nr:phBC6A51 family helix-turn-helix protein [Brevibacillus migulae]
MSKIELGYQPTKAEERLLEVLLDPSSKTMTVAEICQAADQSRQAYYNAMKKPEFVALYEAKSFELVKHSLGPVINAVVQKAKEGSHQHAKIVLAMAGMYSERHQVKSEVDVQGEVVHSGSLNIVLGNGNG